MLLCQAQMICCYKDIGKGMGEWCVLHSIGHSDFMPISAERVAVIHNGALH